MMSILIINNDKNNMKPNKRSELSIFIWRVTSIHIIVYFIAGILALLVLNYKEQYVSGIMSSIMRPIDSPLVVLGPALQVFRGIIIAIVLFPFKDIIISKNGWVKLLLLILGLSYISTIGPVFGSFDGYIYTKVPLQYHLFSIPETLLYTSLFSFLLYLWYNKENKVWNIITFILCSLIAIMNFLGYLSSIGLIKH